MAAAYPGVVMRHSMGETVTLQSFTKIYDIGKGNFGRIWLAERVDNKERVAIKQINVDIVKQGRSRIKIARERKAGLSLDHPNVIKFYHSFQSNNGLEHFFVMEFLPNGDFMTRLNQLVKGQGFPTHVTRFYTAELLLALEYIHSKGWVHRDIKPENLLLDVNHHLKLCDFGFARQLQLLGGRPSTCCGTPAYVAPEILNYEPPTYAMDIWSYGCMVFEFNENFTAINEDRGHSGCYRDIIAGTTRHFARPDTDPNLIDLVDRLLVVNARDRLGSRGHHQIKQHPFYADTEWDRLNTQRPPPFDGSAPRDPTPPSSASHSSLSLSLQSLYFTPQNSASRSWTPQSPSTPPPPPTPPQPPRAERETDYDPSLITWV